MTLDTRQILKFYTYSVRNLRPSFKFNVQSRFTNSSFMLFQVATLCSPLSFFSNRIMLQYMHELFTQQPQEGMLHTIIFCSRISIKIVCVGFLSDPSTLLLDPAVHFFFINIFIQFVLSRILATLLWVDVPAEREFGEILLTNYLA